MPSMQIDSSAYIPTLVQLPPSLGSGFRGPQTKQVYLCEPVRKVTRHKRRTPRIWLVAPGLHLLCRPNGGISRAVLLEEIDKVFLQDLTKTTRITIKCKPNSCEPSQVFEMDQPGDFKQALVILNALRKERVADDLHVEWLPPDLDVLENPETFGEVQKNKKFGYVPPKQKFQRWMPEIPGSPRKSTFEYRAAEEQRKNEEQLGENGSPGGLADDFNRVPSDNKAPPSNVQDPSEPHPSKNPSFDNENAQPGHGSISPDPGSTMNLGSCLAPGPPAHSSTKAALASELENERSRRAQAEKRAWRAERAANALAEQLSQQANARRTHLQMIEVRSEGIDAPIRPCALCNASITPFCSVSGNSHLPDKLTLTLFTKRLTQHCRASTLGGVAIFPVSEWKRFPLSLEKEVTFSITSSEELLGKAGVLVRDLMPQRSNYSPEILWSDGIKIKLNGCEVGKLRFRSVAVNANEDDDGTGVEADRRETLFVCTTPLTHHSLHTSPAGAPIATIEQRATLGIEEAFKTKEGEIWGRSGKYWVLIKDSRGVNLMTRLELSQAQQLRSLIVASLVVVISGVEVTSMINASFDFVNHKLERLKAEIDMYAQEPGGSKLMSTANLEASLRVNLANNSSQKQWIRDQGFRRTSADTNLLLSHASLPSQRPSQGFHEPANDPSLLTSSDNYPQDGHSRIAKMHPFLQNQVSRTWSRGPKEFSLHDQSRPIRAVDLPVFESHAATGSFKLASQSRQPTPLKNDHSRPLVASFSHGMRPITYQSPSASYIRQSDMTEDMHSSDPDVLITVHTPC
ncbi:hypothetical protein DIPPA_65248 [Diplonema papillatum]|nr:hypothetical protein DIPPA_65248 [Diplonema papillatum]